MNRVYLHQVKCFTPILLNEQENKEVKFFDTCRLFLFFVYAKQSLQIQVGYCELHVSEKHV